jgi:hypothetical protein
MTTFFSLLSSVPVFESGIRNPGRVKIRIRDKHPGFATLHFSTGTAVCKMDTICTSFLPPSGSELRLCHHTSSRILNFYPLLS